MNQNIYLIGQLIIVLITFGLISSLMFGLRYAFQLLNLPPKQRKKLRYYITGGIMLWLSILALLAYRGFFRNFEALPPRVLVAVLPPVLIIISLLFSNFLTSVLKVVPMSWLIYIQGFRILMELFLWMGYKGGFVPMQMTFEWLNYDITVGITALMGGYVFFGRGRYHRPQAIVWNIFGIVLLFIIVGISVVSTPGPLRIFMNDPPNTFVAELPFIWIPGFIVPFALAMHLFSLKQLFMERVGKTFLAGKLT